jgi:hypothetical protein
MHAKGMSGKAKWQEEVSYPEAICVTIDTIPTAVI